MIPFVFLRSSKLNFWVSRSVVQQKLFNSRILLVYPELKIFMMANAFSDKYLSESDSIIPS